VSVQKVRSVGVKFWFDVAEAISLDMWDKKVIWYRLKSVQHE
jgi:hypothetical protein